MSKVRISSMCGFQEAVEKITDFVREEVLPNVAASALHGNTNFFSILFSIIEGVIIKKALLTLIALIVYILQAMIHNMIKSFVSTMSIVTAWTKRDTENLRQKSAVPVTVTKTRKASRTDSSRCLFFMSKFDHFV